MGVSAFVNSQHNQQSTLYSDVLDVSIVTIKYVLRNVYTRVYAIVIADLQSERGYHSEREHSTMTTTSAMPPGEKKTIRQLREERGLSREKLASDLGISFGTLVNLEIGRNKPRIDLAEKLYSYFAAPLGSIDWDSPVEEYKARQPREKRVGKALPSAA